MTGPARLDDLFADDALLDRLAAREDVGDEPLALVLGSLASYVDQPIGRHRPAVSRRRPARSQRVAIAGLMAVVMSGAGFAAALSLPDSPERSTLPGQQVRVGESGRTGTPWPTGAGGVSPSTAGVHPSRVSPSGLGTLGARPSGRAANQPGAIPPISAPDGAPPGLVAGPTTPAATPSPESDRRDQRGRPTDLPTTPGQGRAAQPPAPPTGTGQPGQSRLPTSPTAQPG